MYAVLFIPWVCPSCVCHHTYYGCVFAFMCTYMHTFGGTFVIILLRLSQVLVQYLGQEILIMFVSKVTMYSINLLTSV